jgi:hypothetical protein
MAAFAAAASAHMAVSSDRNVCTLRIGFFEARLAMYQPQLRRHQRFCEAVPDAAETVFVMQYTHGPLDSVPIEFRIIRDVTGRGAFASLADIVQAGGIEQATVFHRPPSVAPDVLSLVHDFDAPGWYIGMVTVEYPDPDKVYTAVFPFKVGFTGFGKWPWFAVLVLVIQLHYWHVSGYLSRSWKRLRGLGPRSRLPTSDGGQR